MRMVLYSKTGEEPDWFSNHPYRQHSVVVTGSSQGSAYLQYMIEHHDRPTDQVMMFLHEDSPRTMVQEIGYDLVMATSIIANNHEKSLFRWLWPIGVIGLCDRYGYPQQPGLPLDSLFQATGIKTPTIIHYIYDQTFALKHETMVSVSKDTYRALLDAQEALGAFWEACMTRLWLELYRASKTWSSL